MASDIAAVDALYCPFRKTLLSEHCGCSAARQVFHAEGVSVHCTRLDAQQACIRLHELLVDSARFALRLPAEGERLTHSTLMRIEAGGLRGLHTLQGGTDAALPDIQPLVAATASTYGSLDDIPFAQLLPAMRAFKPRRRGPRS